MADNMNALLSQYAVGIRKALCGIMVSGYNAHVQIGEILSQSDEKTAEQRDCLGGRNRPVVHIAGDKQRRVVVPAKLVRKPVEHACLVVQQGRFMQVFPEMQVTGMKQFHTVYCKNIGESCKGSLL